MNVNVSWLETVIKNYERTKRVSKVTATSCQDAVGKGENFMSKTERVRAHRKFVKENTAFHNEINVYRHILKAMNDVIELNGDVKEPLWCEMIAYQAYDTIILEDLCVKGFKTINRRHMMDLDLGCLVLESLGRFHAISRVLIRDGDICEGDYSKYLFNEGLIARNCYSIHIGVMMDAMRTSWGADWDEVLQRLEILKGTVDDQMASLRKPPIEKMTVLNHGDCWSNNIMIRTAGTNDKPVEVKFIDFQAIHYNSLAWDITYFLYSSMIPSVRRQSYSTLIDCYLKSFEKHLKMYGFDEEAAPTAHEVESEVARLKLFGFLIIIIIHAITTTDINDPFDMERFCTGTDDPVACFNPELYKDTKFKDKVGEDFLQFVKDGVF